MIIRKRIYIPLTFAIVFGSLPAFTGEFELLERIYGPGDLAAISGNGRLTVGTNARGRINLSRWPSPGYHDQLTYHTLPAASGRLTPAPYHGLVWGVELDGDIVWWFDERVQARVDYLSSDSNVIRATAAVGDTPVIMSQTVFVHPERDVLVARLEVEGVDEAPRVHWFANITPCTRKLPEVPMADWGPMDQHNDFAAFAEVERRRVIHLRPNQPGRAEWARAEALAGSGAPAEAWGELGEGVYIAYTAAEPVESVAVMPPTGNVLDTIGNLDEGATDSRAVIGQTAGLLSIQPRRVEERFVATVFVVFGPTLSTVDALLNRTAGDAYDALLQRARDSDRAYLAAATLPAVESDATAGLLRRCVLLLKASTDRRSGAVVRSPATQPALARDWPRLGAWVTYALDLAGLHEAADAHLRFYLNAVRERSKPGQPAGTIPSSLYTDGVPASPHVVLDTEAVAWLLWSLDMHMSFVESADRAAFLDRIWPAVWNMGEFLSGWSDGRGAPLHAFDPTVMHDTQALRHLTSAHLGLQSAMTIATAMDEDIPQKWTRQKRDFDILLQNRFLNEESAWRGGEPLPLSITAIPDVDPGDIMRLLGQVVDERIAGLPELDGREAAAALCELAMLLRETPDERARLAPQLDDTVLRALRSTNPNGTEQPAFPDTVVAAQCFVAAYLLAP